MNDKKLLIEKVFLLGEKESGNSSKNGISYYLSLKFDELFKYPISEKTFVRYYDSFIIAEKDYKIPTLILDYLSKYIGFESYSEFIYRNKYSVNNLENSSHEISYETDIDNLSNRISKIAIKVVVNPIIKLPELLTKQSNLGIIGVLLLGGFLFNKFYNVEDKKQIESSLVQSENEKSSAPETKVSFTSNDLNNVEPNIIEKENLKKDMQCMYWEENHFVPSFCDEPQEGKQLIAFDENTMLIKKIERPDTLTLDNAIGKVWYDKSNNKVEFFTHFGLHPENGKTLKKVTAHIIGKYASK